jgi:hypothetical protein
MNPEQPIETAALSWILELPRDLGLPEDTAAAVATMETAVPGWEDRLDCLPDWPGHPTNAVPFRRLRFRRIRAGVGISSEAALRTYWQLAGMPRLTRLRHEALLKLEAWRGDREWKTVCQLTQWYLGDSIPDLPDGVEVDERSPLRTDLAQMLEMLDLWLQTYGWVAEEVDIGAIALHDLPAVVPWFLQRRSSPDSYDRLLTGTLPIHGRLPDLEPAQGDDWAGYVASLVANEGPDAYPLLTPMLMLFQAQGHALAGRSRQAVIDMGTAVESVVMRVIHDAMTIRGRSKSEIEEVLERRWRDLFNRDLLDLFEVPVGQAGPQHSKWWSKHYRTRNEVVHSGARVSQDVAMSAVLDSADLIEWISERLREQPDLAPLGEALKIKRLEPDDDQLT